MPFKLTCPRLVSVFLYLTYSGCILYSCQFNPELSFWPQATLAPGAYAISVDAKMPEDIFEQLLENDLRPHRVLATAPKLDSER
jgi:hypothetical protein